MRCPEQKCFKVVQLGLKIKVGKQSRELFPSLAVPKGEGKEAEEEKVLFQKLQLDAGSDKNETFPCSLSHFPCWTMLLPPRPPKIFSIFLNIPKMS